ncbi:MAG: DUF4184 family protein [Chitinophagaceae bacterium]|nr:DUF4184 family protein [Chitinophagaceae bacterium]
MPFTVAHIAAVLPFKKRTPQSFSFTGLIIGSMVPDFEYFARMTLYGHYGHTFSGILIFDMPMGVLLYFLYHAVVRRQLISHLPGHLYAKFSDDVDVDWKTYSRRHFLLILLSLLTGIMTHLLWDGFTHDEEYVVARYIPLLLMDIHIAGFSFPLHSLLQGFSSIAGMVILFFFIYRMPAGAGVQTLSRRELLRFWLMISIFTVILDVVRWCLGVPNEKLVGQFIVIGMSAGMLSLILVCFYYSISKSP